MKKIIIYMLALCLSVSFMPARLQAAPKPEKIQTASEKMEAQQLKDRLDEINSIDKTTLSKQDRKTLRKEVRSIDRQLRAISGGVYISASALLIILLLILIL